jgi:hypothetical protein
MRKIIVPLALAAVMLSGCSSSLRDTDPAGFEACSKLDKARDKSTDTAVSMDLILFGVGEKAVLAKTESIRTGVEDSPLISKLSKTAAYSIKDSLAQACRDAGVPVREVTKSK